MSWKYFTEDELRCKHTGDIGMNEQFMQDLDRLREACGFPFNISSGYRSPKHPVEAKKKKPNFGAHTQGCAVDVLVYGGRAVKVIEEALKLGFNRFGVNQRGPIESRFIHVEKYSRDELGNSKKHWTWSY